MRKYPFISIAILSIFFLSACKKEITQKEDPTILSSEIQHNQNHSAADYYDIIIQISNNTFKTFQVTVSNPAGVLYTVGSTSYYSATYTLTPPYQSSVSISFPVPSVSLYIAEILNPNESPVSFTVTYPGGQQTVTGPGALSTTCSLTSSNNNNSVQINTWY